MQKFIIIFGCCLSLAGCQTMQQQQQKSQAQMEQEQITSLLKNTQTSFNSCQEEARKSELYKRVFDEVFFELEDSPNKFTMISNKNKPTTEQIELVKDAMPIITKCRSVVIEGRRNTPFSIVDLKYYNAIDVIFIKLIKGESTIGDANEERVKVIAQHKIDWVNAGNELNSRLRAMHDSEMAGKRQAAAALMPYLMQQQQNQQQQQQMLYQQQMQSIINNKPILTSPTTTNCSTLGNQINCTTR